MAAFGEKEERQWNGFREKMKVGEERRKQCAGLCRQYWLEDCQRTIKTADELLTHTFLFQLPWDMEQTQEPVRFSGEINWNYVLCGDREFTYQMNRHRYWICLGQAYALTGEEKYAREFVFQLLDWLEKEPWTPENEETTWRSLEAGLRADYWVRAMELCADSPAVTKEVAARFWEGLNVHARRLYENPREAFSKKSNWGVMEYAGLYLLGLLLENEEYTEKARQYLTQALHIQVMDDGIHWEASPMYHNEVLMAYLEVLRIANIWGDVFFGRDEIEIIEKMAYASMDLQTPSGCQPMTGDSDDTDIRDLLSEAALLLNSRRLKAGGFSCLDAESIWLFGPEGFARYQNIKEEGPEAGLVLFPSSGQAVLRSRWGKEGDWLYFKNGPIGGGHGHMDKLHIGLWLNGEEVLADSGRCTYKDVPERYALKAPQAHNVPLLKNKSYAGSEDTWRYFSLPQCFPNQAEKKGEFLFLEGAHGGYEAQGMIIRRRVAAAGFRILAVNDTFLGNVSEETVQFFHFAETIRLRKNGEGAEGTGKRCRVEIKAFSGGQPASMDIGTSPISRHYNQRGQRAMLRVSGEGRTLTTFLVQSYEGEKVEIVPETVYCAVSGCALPPEKAEGYRILSGEEEFGFVFLQDEAGNGADYNGFCGIYGLGRTMAYHFRHTQAADSAGRGRRASDKACDLGQKPENMTVLQW